MRRLGPELKMPELKVPHFVSDLYWDLRDRHMLPLIAIAVVAIAAVPFLLGGGSEAPPAEPTAGGATASAEREAAEAASLTVVEAKPGLRDYRKRLAGRTPTDPFEQRYTAQSTESAELSSPSEGSSSTVGTVTTTTTTGSTGSSTAGTTTTTSSGSPPSTSPSTTPPSKPSSGGGGGKPHLTFYTWAIDARISKSGGKNADPKDSQEPVVKHKVLPQTRLPGEKAGVVTYMGLSRKAAEKHHAAKALLLVSNSVKSVSGEAECVSGGEVCQLLEVEPGFPITFVYGANETRYTIKVLKIDLVVTGHS